MRKSLWTVVLLVCFAWTGTARAYELVNVLSGDTLLVTRDGEELHLELVGVWVPAPPIPGVEPEYGGSEALGLVREALFMLPVYIREVGPRTEEEGHVRVPVRVRLGDHGEYDLAVLLAHAGLGLVHRSSSADPEHLDAIYEAERTARREERGMHDGGYQEFRASEGGLLVDFGLSAIAPPDRRGRQPRRRILIIDGGDGSGGSGAGRQSTLRDPVSAIRDWGSRMGLPRDHSRPGR